MTETKHLDIDYKYGQIDLACLDTHCGDYSDYGLCLQLAHRHSSVSAIGQMFEANGAMTYDSIEHERGAA